MPQENFLVAFFLEYTCNALTSFSIVGALIILNLAVNWNYNDWSSTLSQRFMTGYHD